MRARLVRRGDIKTRHAEYDRFIVIMTDEWERVLKNRNGNENSRLPTRTIGLAQ